MFDKSKCRKIVPRNTSNWQNSNIHRYIRCVINSFTRAHSGVHAYNCLVLLVLLKKFEQDHATTYNRNIFKICSGFDLKVSFFLEVYY